MSFKISAQSWLPAVIGAVALACVLVLWHAQNVQDEEQINRVLDLKAQAVRDELLAGLDVRAQALLRMVRRWEIGGRPDRLEWESDAKLYLEHYVGYEAIEWIDSARDVRWTMPAGAAAVSIPGIEGVTAQTLRATPGYAFSRVFDLPDNEIGVAVVLPLSRGADGYIVGVFRLRQLLAVLLQPKLAEEGYIPAVQAGDRPIYGSAESRSEYVGRTELELQGARWQISVVPSASQFERIDSHLPEVTLLLGTVVSLMLAAAVYFAQVARRRQHALEQEIVERRRAEQEVERHASELERSNRDLQQFAYVASHDLQEPLRIVSGYVQLLGKRYRGKLDSQADEFIAFAVDGVTRMQTLIRDLLAYSRVGSREKQLRPLNCEKVLAGALASLRAAVEDAGAVVTHDPLPTVIGDESQFNQLFMNLLSNAVKYRGERQPRIHVSATAELDAWRFAVQDNGIGIEARHYERIFEIFQRLHGKTEYSGTGIGLAICKKVVENHGGHIWVESEPGVGSTFYFTIPVKEQYST